jgi:hypothetical protein
MKADVNSALVVIAATALEANAVRRACPDLRVEEVGIALANVSGAQLGEIVVSCGLAGGLRDDLAPGTLLVPREVRRPNGETLRCDAQLFEALVASARRFDLEPVLDPLMTADTIVNGAARRKWAARGYAGVDMETGRVIAPRVAAVRVILDTPRHELSADWQDPRRAMLRPRNWAQALWLAREAPRGAKLAARILAGAAFA